MPRVKRLVKDRDKDEDEKISGMSLAGKREIDIDAAVRRKIEINKTRPWKHGKE